MKIVINTCYGGFSLSHEAVMAYGKALGLKLNAYVSDYAKSNKTSIYKAYDGKGDVFRIHYSTAKLNKDGTLPNEGYFSTHGIKRDDPKLVKIVEKMGDKANGTFAKLKIVEIPDGVEWQISEYDGIETIEETHRSWN